MKSDMELYQLYQFDRQQFNQLVKTSPHDYARAVEIGLIQRNRVFEIGHKVAKFGNGVLNIIDPNKKHTSYTGGVVTSLFALGAAAIGIKIALPRGDIDKLKNRPILFELEYITDRNRYMQGRIVPALTFGETNIILMSQNKISANGFWRAAFGSTQIHDPTETQIRILLSNFVDNFPKINYHASHTHFQIASAPPEIQNYLTVDHLDAAEKIFLVGQVYEYSQNRIGIDAATIKACVIRFDEQEQITPSKWVIVS